MTKKPISQKVLKKIKNQKIKPKPKWQFKTINYLFWAIGIICLIIGAISVSIAVFQINIGDWDTLRFLGGQGIGLLWQSLPRFWLGMMILFLVFSYYGITHTKTGYRYKKAALIIGLILIVLFIGTSLQALNYGQRIDQGFQRKIPGYQRLRPGQGKNWQMPDQGRIAGTILSISNKNIKIKDFQNNTWNIDVSNARIPFKDIKKGDQIRVIGEKTDNQKIKAKAVLPWQKHRAQPLGFKIPKPLMK